MSIIRLASSSVVVEFQEVIPMSNPIDDCICIPGEPDDPTCPVHGYEEDLNAHL